MRKEDVGIEERERDRLRLRGPGVLLRDRPLEGRAFFLDRAAGIFDT
ncbi:MAG: hypothetical protein M3R06_04300 [Chloroflexota bacterium]|nr:hypothetical protein [Chloroflexota bacterium]